MSQDPCPPSNPEIDAILANPNLTGSEIVAALRQYNIDRASAAWGVSPSNVALPVAETAPQQSSGGGAFRVIYPHGNSRFELEGNSEAELDEQEKKIRAMYGKK